MVNTFGKIFASTVAILSFTFYAFYLRMQDMQSQVVAQSTPVETTIPVQQLPSSGSPTASASTSFQSYIDQINAEAAQNQTSQGQQQTPTQAQQQATAQAQAAQQQAAAQAQAQQQAAQLAAQQQAAAQAKAQQQAAQLAAQQQAAAQAQAAAQSSGQYKNGTYTGASVNVYYGYVQVQVVIQGGQIAAVNFLQYPNDRSTSVYINQQAMPLLKQEAIQAQSANINGVSGASATSQGFVQSLNDALSQA